MTRVFILFPVLLAAAAAHAEVSAVAGTPFKLGTITVDGRERVAMLLDGRVVDVQRANSWLAEQPGAEALELPGNLKGLIEQSAATLPRLFQVANALHGRLDEVAFDYDLAEVRIEAPIRYPWHLLAAGQNYREHAAEMGGDTDIDPDKDDPFLFAKSARSGIIGPGEPYRIPPGRDRIDWEGEFAIVVGREAKNLTLDNALDHVFGFTIVFDVSDRAAQIPENGRYARDWFAGKSMDNAAPMGPWVVPKEFLSNYADLRLTTRVNGELMQDSSTSYLIHDVERLLRYATSIVTLWPGDVIATGTPSGVGNGRKPPVYLRPGDVVTIEVEGIGVLETPIE